jgi:hypothetical protein
MNKTTTELNLELFERLLVAERSRLDEEIAQVRAASGVRRRGRPKTADAKPELENREPAKPAKPAKKNSLAEYNRTPEARRKQRLRMKKFWANKKAEQAKAERKAARKKREVKRATTLQKVA